MTIEEFNALPTFYKNKQLRLAEEQQKKYKDNKQYLKTAGLVTQNGVSKDFLHFLLQETIKLAEQGTFQSGEIV